ncbi:MAG: hypothetical protein WCW35_10200 [Bacteroidota bacterium]|jgi:hypothetical protein
MYVYRIHIRPQGGLANPKLSVQYCLDNNYFGVGWQIPKGRKENIDWETYKKRAAKKYGTKKNGVHYIKKWVSKDDLVWTRDTNGIYYIGKVLSPWEYVDSAEARDADIVNVFRVRIIKVGSIDEVPGKIIACFRASRTIQEIGNSTAITYSKKLWNELSGKREYEIKKTESVWDLLSDEQVEDLIFLYLQFNNWYVVPNSRKKDTMAYEYYLINKANYRRALVQAKTGNSFINFDDYLENKELIFLFQPNNCYSGRKRKGINIISKEILEVFIKQNRYIIPANILKWFP